MLAVSGLARGFGLCRLGLLVFGLVLISACFVLEFGCFGYFRRFDFWCFVVVL